MASKGPRSKLDHDSRARKQKVFEAPKEPPRPKTHWDHVLEEMVWLSKDFEAERKWKLAQAKRVAIRASKNYLDYESRGEKKVKEEEQRVRKVALNISKEVKKFWMKIEKLVLYKHQLELEEKKKKALDKQLDFLLGQTERYSTMLAENLVDMPSAVKSLQIEPATKEVNSPTEEEEVKYLDVKSMDLDQSESMEVDNDFLIQSEDKEEDDEHTIEEDEIHITKEERNEEVAALQAEMDLPLEELLKNYTKENVSREVSPESLEDEPTTSSEDQNNDFQNKGDKGHLGVQTRRSKLHVKDQNMQSDEPDDRDYILVAEEEKDDEATLSEEEELAKKETSDPLDEINLLQQESELPIEELLARYKKEVSDDGTADSESASSSSDDHMEDCENNKDAQFTENKSTEANCDQRTAEKNDENLDKKESENIIEDAAAAARSAQPTGNTFSTTKVRTKFPFLIKHSLREYQHIGLDWLVTMYEKRLNGILADEMGLGKTIMTISLLAHLACEKGIWGPHLIVVPTSVMLNWETEFLKWCPAFKILTYFGSAKERKYKRQGWMKPNYFHICITTYRLVIQDSKIFKRKKWKYLILDEAHLIKNWKSQRWQTLLNFNSKRRILLTGTPLQNDLMELWSLMHFLMPHIFQSHQEFKDWFSNPISGMVEGQETVNKEVVDRLHNVLRPFILRRLKRDVEKQLPKKYEHVIYCRLSKRQRNLYEDFIASSETQATLASTNYFGMISVIMQLRKVCNHPDLFEGRPIVSSFDMPNINMQLSSHISTILSSGPFSHVDLRSFNLVFTHLEFAMTSWESDEIAAIACPFNLNDKTEPYGNFDQRGINGNNIFHEIQRALYEERLRQLKERAASISWWSSLRCKKKPVYGTNLIELVSIKHPVSRIHEMKNNPSSYLNFSSKLADMVLSPVELFHKMLDLIESFMFAIPPSRAPPPNCWCTKRNSPVILHPSYIEKCTEVLSPLLTPIRTAIVRRQVYFPDRRLIQFDCGKLQELAALLRRLKFEGHRVLIFTQMTKMLDILEAFINLYGYTYMRLDGSTQPEERQTLMQRFNTNPKYFIFILSTRSGGVGINLVGADTVIFYDSDWNPAMDQQAQDRCHRIGQTREVNIYRLITESTIEENILKKANQKRLLDDLVIQSGSYNTEFFKKLDPIELFSGRESKNELQVLSNADVEAALKQAEDEADYMALKRVEQEEAVDNQEFTEEVIGKMDDDEIVNDDDVKNDERIIEDEMKKDNDVILSRNNENDLKTLGVVGGDEDIDMLADAKQMAAKAAAAGEASSSFENQLRPIDRYAMHFLHLWDPIIDKSVAEYREDVNEEEWELDRIEKYKEDLEAEIDEDQEPFLYEKWDADFATKAYKQHVEALAQQQLLEEQEYEAQETENEAMRNEETMECKPKSKKKPKMKPKKTKLKSLKKGSLSSEVDISSDELQIEPYDYVLSPDSEPSCTESPPNSPPKKRKKSMLELEEEKYSKKSSKKPKKTSDWKLVEDSNSSIKQMAEVKDSKTTGRISITVMPMKRVMVVKPERLKKKTNVWSKDSFPPPYSWSSQEDAMLCATVHEYGTNWTLVSDVIASMPLGALYRGCFRHPVHCCERFRELVLKFVHSPADGSNTEKSALSGSGKALLKVTEEQARSLLDFTTEQPNTDLHLQKHFVAILSAVWKAKCSLDRNDAQFRKFSSHSSEKKSEKLTENTNLRLLKQSSKLVFAALLNNINEKVLVEPRHVLSPQLVAQKFTDHVDITLDFLGKQDDYETSFPSSVVVSMHEQGPQLQETDFHADTFMAESSCKIAEARLRLASEACIEGESSGWASSAFPSFNNSRYRSSAKSQILGKHKFFSDSVKAPKCKIQKTTELTEEWNLYTKLVQRSPRPSMEFYDLPQITLHCGNDHHFPLLSSLDANLMEIPSLEYIPEDYDPEFISGLEDVGSLQDITDVG